MSAGRFAELWAGAAEGDASHCSSKGGLRDGPSVCMKKPLSRKVSKCARFNQPRGLCVGAHGKLSGVVFVADSRNGVIRRLVPAGAGRTGCQVDTIVKGGPGFADGDPKSAKFNFPTGCCLTDKSDLVVADTHNSCIRLIQLDEYGRALSVSTLAGCGIRGDADGECANCRFNDPMGVAARGAFVYVSDTLNHSIKKIDLKSKTVSKLPLIDEDGEAVSVVPAVFYAAAITASQSIISVLIVFFNTPIPLYACNRRLGKPEGLAFAPNGDLLVAAKGDNAIMRIKLATCVVELIAGRHTSTFRNKELQPAFCDPTELAVDESGRILVTDFQNDRVCAVVDNEVSDIWNTKAGYLAEATAEMTSGHTYTANEFEHPYGIAIGPGGEIYVSDTANHQIIRIAGLAKSPATTVYCTLHKEFLSQIAIRTGISVGKIVHLNETYVKHQSNRLLQKASIVGRHTLLHMPASAKIPPENASLLTFSLHDRVRRLAQARNAEIFIRLDEKADVDSDDGWELTMYNDLVPKHDRGTVCGTVVEITAQIHGESEVNGKGASSKYATLMVEFEYCKMKFIETFDPAEASLMLDRVASPTTCLTEPLGSNLDRTDACAASAPIVNVHGATESATTTAAPSTVAVAQPTPPATLGLVQDHEALSIDLASNLRRDILMQENIIMIRQRARAEMKAKSEVLLEEVSHNKKVAVEAEKLWRTKAKEWRNTVNEMACIDAEIQEHTAKLQKLAAGITSHKRKSTTKISSKNQKNRRSDNK